MQRGGRFRGSRGGHAKGPNLPFEVDPELAEAVDLAEEEARSSDDDVQKDLFPELTEYIMAAPITEEERRSVQIERDIQAKRRAGPFWTGTRDEWAEIDSKSGEGFNPFESVPTYGKKRARKPFQLASLKRIKVCYPEFLPKELHSVVTDRTDETDQAEQPKKKLGLAKKAAVDRLTKLNDDDDEVNDNTDQDADSDDEGDKEDEDEFEREPEDDDFVEDEEEADDYNAEKYFDDGEDDVDDYGGDDYADDGF